MSFREKYLSLCAEKISEDELDRFLGRYIWNNARSIKIVFEDENGEEFEVDNPYIRVNEIDLGYNFRLEYDDYLSSKDSNE